MDYKHAAQQVLDCIGGKENIVSAAHCATRLRLVIADNSKVNKKELENAEGAKGVFEAQGQLQIIFGTGTVNKVYDEFIQLAGIEGGTKEDVKQAAAAKAPWYQRAIKTLGDIFVPIIPAIVASGFLMGIMEALNFMVNNGFLNIDTTGSVYVFAKLFSNTAYTFLPILIAYSAAKVFGGNPYLGAVIGMIMIHPDLQNAWTVSNGVNVMQPVFGGLYSVPLVGYQGHVIPVIIAVWLMCQKVKSMALPSAMSACMGITEPAIFGVNLRYFKPFIGGLLGGACGALYASIVGLGATGTGVTGIFGILLHLHMPLQYIIMMAISFGVSFAVTWIIWKPEEVKA